MFRQACSRSGRNRQLRRWEVSRDSNQSADHIARYRLRAHTNVVVDMRSRIPSTVRIHTLRPLTIFVQTATIISLPIAADCMVTVRMMPNRRLAIKVKHLH